MGSNYNSKPLAAEVLLDRGSDHLVRPRQGSASLFASESIPG
jgi:diaminopimelate decarboxylase